MDESSSPTEASTLTGLIIHGTEKEIALKVFFVENHFGVKILY